MIKYNRNKCSANDIAKYAVFLLGFKASSKWRSMAGIVSKEFTEKEDILVLNCIDTQLNRIEKLFKIREIESKFQQAL